jgi:hypothetical protein
MAWFDDMVTLLRYSINDVDTPQTYTDSRLQQAILVGARFVNREFDFTVEYNSDLNLLTLTPDPTTVQVGNDIRDDWFINLTVMRSALFMLQNDLKLAGNSAWSIKDIDVNIDLRQLAEVKKKIYQEMVDYYDHQGMQYRCGVYSAGASILTPFNILAGNIRGGPMTSWTDRDRCIW